MGDKGWKNERVTNLLQYKGEELKRYIFTYVKNYKTTDEIFKSVIHSSKRKISSSDQDSEIELRLFEAAAKKSKRYLRLPFTRGLWAVDHWVHLNKGITPKTQQSLSNDKSTLIDSIMELPVKLREVVILHCYCGFQFDDIYRILDISASELNSRWVKAENKLNARVEESGITSRDFDFYIGSKRLHKNTPESNGSASKNKFHVPRNVKVQFAMVICLACIVFFVQYEEANKSISADLDIHEQLERTLSFPENEEDLYKMLTRNIRGWDRAKSEGLVKNMDFSFKLPNRDGELKFEKMFNSGQRIHFIYSLPVREEDLLKPTYDIRLDEMYFYENKIVGNSPSQFKVMHYREGAGIYYNDRIYRAFSTQLFYRMNQDEIDSFDEEFKVDFYMNIDNQREVIEDEKINLVYDREAIENTKLEVNEKVEVILPSEDKLGIEIKEMELGFEHSSMKLLVDSSNGERVGQLRGYIDTGSTTHSFSSWVDQNGNEDNEMKVNFAPLDENPDELTIHFTDVDFISDEELSFDFEPGDVDFNDTKESIFEFEQKIKEFKGSEIYFKELKKRRGDWFIVLNQVNDEDSNEHFVGRQDYMGIQGQQGNKVSITNDENSFSSVDHGMYVDGNGEVGYMVESYFLNNSETVHFKLERLIYGMKFDEAIDIDLQDKS